mmetsp:Transcript_7223/g.17706  ORF Transcript_7223/g.17706 Transcript_7223/m.17706 type:complete len:658 (-) Transcript_7223:215-2188(-)
MELSTVPKPACPEIPGETVPRVCSFYDKTIIDTPAGIESGFDIFSATADRVPGSRCLGWRPVLEGGKLGPYEYVSYAEARELAVAIGTALVKSGLGRGDKVGVFSKNCPAWSLTQNGANSQGLILVPLYDTLGENAVEYITNHAECTTVFVSEENYPSFMKTLPKCPSVTQVVVFSAGDPREKVKVTLGEKSIGLSDLLATGSTAIEDAKPGKIDEVFIIMYTSGTTGDPKGVIHVNRAMVVMVYSMLLFKEHFQIELSPDDSFFSFLPLAHIFAQQAEILIFAFGGHIDYFCGDVRKLADDLAISQPALFVGVPRVYARFEEKVRDTVAKGSKITQAVFNFAYNLQKHYIDSGAGRSKVLDALVFNKIKAKIFPRGKIALSGGAPMSADTNDFLRIVLNMPILQGYGLSETVGGWVCAFPDSASGHCGGLVPVGEIKLVDVAEMNYTKDDVPYPRGEVRMKGAALFTGYFKNEKQTKESFDDDGYFCTGDIGQWLPDGALQIIDRKKNLFKMSQGEYVSPEFLENEYAKCNLIAQIWVYGNSFHNNLVAVVVPSIATYKEWAEQNAHGGESLEEVAALPEFKKAVLEELAARRKEAKLKGFEVISDIIFETEVDGMGQGFTVDNELTTPTMKLKRPQLKKRYEKEIDAMYEKLNKK